MNLLQGLSTQGTVPSPATRSITSQLLLEENLKIKDSQENIKTSLPKFSKTQIRIISK
jgi:hypothetical protein